MLRNRKNKISLDTVRELDSFPKLPETYIETSRVGGTCKYIVYRRTHTDVNRINL